MTATQVPASAIPSFDKVKMEDRKRALAHDADDSAPSRKRLMKDENGQAMRMDADKEKEVESYQKDAILRQMKEYKRQKNHFEEQVRELQDKVQYHDDHIRTIDAWFAQTLDEIRVLVGQQIPTPPPSATTSGEEMYKAALIFGDNDAFSKHLRARSAAIEATITDIFSRLPQSSPEILEYQKQIGDTLAREKETAVQLRKAVDERESLQERLEQASYRYMTAEKKLDRAKSTQVLKLERAAMHMGGNSEVPSPTTSKKGSTAKRDGEVNGDSVNGTTNAEAEAARKEALAAAERQKAQLEEIELENERLTNELSAARTKLASLSDDEFAETALFKVMRLRCEDAVKKANDLEATNVRIREELQKFVAERTSYRSAVDEEHRANNAEIEAQAARAENDLARIRNIRDELQAETNVLRSAGDGRRVSGEQTKDLAAAQDSRILALESEVERMKLQVGESQAPATDGDAEETDVETLRSKLRTLQGQYSLLSNELPSMEAAWRKTQALASKKIDEISGWEEQIARLSAEKAKADQKYFATMKVKDLQSAELRSLKSQNARSSEIVSQLKETDGKTRELLANLERQVAEARESLAKLEQQYRSMEQKHNQVSASSLGFKKQVEELKSLVGSKDQESFGSAKAKREAEEELEKCRLRLEDFRKANELMKKSLAGATNANSDEWRRLAICPVCSANIRNTVIKLCGHVFCSDCVKDLISNRSRKCPTCGRAFGNGDHMPVVLT